MEDLIKEKDEKEILDSEEKEGDLELEQGQEGGFK